MNAQSSTLHVPYRRIIGIQAPALAGGRKPPPVQLCRPYDTGTLVAALQPEYRRLVGIRTDNDWLLVQLPRDRLDLVGLPLIGKHPCGSWRQAWENEYVELFSLDMQSGEWSAPIEAWEELIET